MDQQKLMPKFVDTPSAKQIEIEFWTSDILDIVIQGGACDP